MKKIADAYEPPIDTIPALPSGEVIMKQLQSEPLFMRRRQKIKSRRLTTKRLASFPNVAGKLTLRDQLKLRHVHACPFTTTSNDTNDDTSSATVNNQHDEMDIPVTRPSILRRVLPSLQGLFQDAFRMY